ncbi:MAG: DUF805 domain-containing protein [Oscillospiraceae bacterium]|nr:DUF805 domain-containing protein [Oscillospiraceae bacterium]
MSFTEAVKTVLGKYTDFTGRARRSEFWYWALFEFLIGAVFGVLVTILGGQNSFLGGLVYGLFYLIELALLIPSLAVIWRRLHDVGKSGVYFLFILIPLVGAILLLVWYCQDSQSGENEYGPNPKGE